MNESWQEKCSNRLKDTIEYDLEGTLQTNLDIKKYIEDNSFNQKYMFSDVSYADECELGIHPSQDTNRSFYISFYELILKDGRIRYRSATSLEDLYNKYGNIFSSVRQIKQVDYDRLRERANHLGEDDLE